MKYFTKYLPVEGEIKKGEKYIWLKGPGMGTGYVVDDEYAVNSYRKEGKLSKLKLYLCTRDIQVGDEYYNESFEFTKYPNKSIAGSSTEWVGENGSYKVVGEISPDATWVTEGEELSEDDIRKFFLAFDSVQYVHVKEDFYNTYPKKKKVNIKVKGPCGHYH